jgi:hypothetical protein
LTTQDVPRFSKLLVPRPPSLLQVTWQQGNAQFLVPTPNQVLNLIEQRIREMA